MRVLVFGSSIAQGFWDTEGGWVQRLRNYYTKLELKEQKGVQPTIFNLGISGDTTKGVLARLENETKARIWPGEEIVYIIAIGLNDTVYRGNEFECTPEKYKRELRDVLSIAKEYSRKILFIGLTPVIDERVQPMSWSTTGKCYSNERVNKFDQALKEFCNNNKVPYLSVFKRFQEAQTHKELMPDGVHPNNAGHELIFKLVRPELDKLIAQNNPVE